MKTSNNPGARPEHFRESTTREKVLKNIRHALIEPADNPFAEVEFDSEVFRSMPEEADVNFAVEFTKVGGKFVFCDSPADMLAKVKAVFADNGWNEAWCFEDSLSGLLNHAGIHVHRDDSGIENMKIAVTSCEFLIARLGSVMMSSQQYSGRRLFSYPEIHIVIAFTTQIVPDIKYGLAKLREKYENGMPSMVSLITGPSRTADIEKTLVTGAHGPKQIFVFMADNAD